MSIETFERVKSTLFAHEGGYVDHPSDPGGATNWGITIGTLSNARGYRVTKQDVKDLTKEEATLIYKARYWDSVKGDQLPSGVDYAVYDYSVNSGPGRAGKELQRVVGASVDGVIGTETLDRVRTCGKTSREIIIEICDRRLAFMKRLKHWRTFGKGWSRRVSDVRLKSLSYAANSPITDHATPDVPPTPKAKPEDKSATGAWKTPQGVATGVGAVSGLGGMLSGTGPIQWALAAVFVIAAVVGAIYVVKSFKERDD